MFDVEVENLTKRFGDFLAVDHLNFAVEHGEVFGLLGPNGAGKSTLIRMLTTLVPPTSGAARVNGFDVARKANDVRQSIGVIPQAMTSDLDLSAVENMTIFAKLYGIVTRKAAAHHQGPAQGRRSRTMGGQAGEDVFRRHAPAPGDRARPGA
jgi:ABC-2 type transport system ATP-binding protein